jgi:serine/threonine protein kinase
LIDTSQNPINCGSFGCGYLSTDNDFHKKVVVKVLKVCPEVVQPNQDRFPVDFAKEIQVQIKAANLGVAPRI